MTTTDTAAQAVLDAEAHAALQEHGGNATKAAHALGLARTTFRTRISRHAALLEEQAGHAPIEAPAEVTDAGVPAATPVSEYKVVKGLCACQCGAPAGRTFVRGHDSVLAKKLRAAYASGDLGRDAVLFIAQTVSDRFHGKLARSIASADAGAAARGGACICGCGEAAARTFARGHDSRYASKLRAAYAGGRARDAILADAASVSERFLGKVTRALDKADAAAAGVEVAA